MPHFTKHPLPSCLRQAPADLIIRFLQVPAFLSGILTPSAYNKWLTNRSRILLWRDQKRRKPYAASSTKAEYRSLIHDAVMRGGKSDPYTGDALDWTLIGEWKDTKELRDVFEKKFALMPTVDHTDPDALGFEICSMLVNFCKTDLRPEEFVGLCGKVVAFRTVPKPAMWKPINPDSRFKKFLLPPFLSGFMTVRAYNNWLDAKAHKLFVRDKKLGKAFAFSATQARYKELIHAAAQNGQFDPYTGDALRWDLVGAYDNVSAHEKGDAYKRKFYLLPTVDHTDPEVLGLEICSWLVNECKNFLNAEEFIAFCGRVAAYRAADNRGRTG
jgi:hypothetical protein